MQGLFVLLPSKSGGAITVTNPAGTQDLAQAGHAVRVRGAREAPSAPFAMSAAEVARVFGEALAAQPAAPVRLILYFQNATDELVPESRALLPAVVQAIRERRSTDVGIVGHADTVGGRRFNYRLGLRRAERVRGELQVLGAGVSMLVVDSHGEDDLLVPTPDGVPEPRNRRVEVTVR